MKNFQDKKNKISSLSFLNKRLLYYERYHRSVAMQRARAT